MGEEEDSAAVAAAATAKGATASVGIVGRGVSFEQEASSPLEQQRSQRPSSGGGALDRGSSFSTASVPPSSKASSFSHRASSRSSSSHSINNGKEPMSPLRQLRRRHTHTGHHHRSLKHAGSFGPGVGLLHRLKTSFRLELESHKKGPSLTRCVRWRVLWLVRSD
jgi:hypothetical protein